MSSPKQIIPAFYNGNLSEPETEPFLRVAEFYCDTIQGEGINIGQAASFLRLQNCSLNCMWCDTQEVWRKGNPYTFNELFELIDKYGLVRKWQQGQHLVITGGSPLLQKEALYLFIEALIDRYHFKPYIEVENECVITPQKELLDYIDCWNNSPKLTNNGMAQKVRYKPDTIKFMSSLSNSWFKFVITDPGEWIEINEFYLAPKIVKREQIILMAEGDTLHAQLENREKVISLAIDQGVRYTDRLHILLWDKKTGV